MCKKFLLGAVFSMAIFLTACSQGGGAVTETSAEITFETMSESVSETKTSTAALSETSATTAEVTEKTEETEIGDLEYFSALGFEISERYRNSYELTVDLDEFPEPFEGVEDKRLLDIDYLTLLNVDGKDLSFLDRFALYDTVNITDYSGSADFSGMKNRFVFDNYMGGDLSTVDFCERLYPICFENYSGEYPLNTPPKDDIVNFYFENFADGVDFGFIAEYPNVRSVRLEDKDIGGVDLNFIKDCKNLGYISLTGRSVDGVALAEIVQNSSVKDIYINVEEYSSEEAELLMKATPEGWVSYNLDSSPWDYTKTPTEGVAVFANLLVNKNAVKKQWDCQVSGAQPYPETWNYHGSLVCTFTNFTEEAQTVNSVQIFRDEKGKTEAMPFADGSMSHKLDFAIDPDTNSDLDITEDIFIFSECETGIYKVVFDVNGERLEQRFFIFNGDENFLTEEQQEAFDKAYEITERYFGCSTYLPQEYADEHTAEEFLENVYEGYTREYAYSKSLGNYIDSDGKLIAIIADRGGDISVQENFFVPIYADENEVLFKTFVIHGHEDYPYYIWFEEMNFHMVKTDEGWRFDKFDIWY